MIQPDPLVRLYAIDIPSDPRTKYRLTAYPQEVNFERDSLGAAIPYRAASIIHEDARLDTEGTIQTTRLQIQNVTREAIAILENYHGLTGEKVRFVAIYLSNMPDGLPEKDEVFDILDSNATESVVELVLGRAALAQRKMNDRRASRLYCVHKYGGPGCGYDTTRAGALQTCSKLEAGPNGCIEHGLDEEDASLENRHPKRILAFRGIPRQSGVGVA